MAKSRTYTDDQFVEAVASSTSYRQALGKLNLNQTGGNYKSMKDRITSLGLDISHMVGKCHNKGKFPGPKRPLSDYFYVGSPIQSHRLRLRLIKEGYKQASCESCGLTEWLGEPIPLELDHISGNHKDNRLENLRILCPNCHYQTPTHRGKNKTNPNRA